MLMKENSISLPAETPSRVNVFQMFDRISRRYDLLNHVLSLGLDIYWRNTAVRELDRELHLQIVDLACGTGDVAIAAARAEKRRNVLAIDMAGQMLALAQVKAERAGLQKQVHLTRGDGMHIPVGK